MMPPVSLPLNGGTVSARAGVNASIPLPATSPAANRLLATRLLTPIIRIADSISLKGTLKRIRRHEKNGRRFAAGLSAGVAALHLTLSGLHGTVPASDHRADYPCTTSLHPPKRLASNVAALVVAALAPRSAS